MGFGLRFRGLAVSELSASEGGRVTGLAIQRGFRSLRAVVWTKRQN